MIENTINDDRTVAGGGKDMILDDAITSSLPSFHLR